MSDTFTIDLVVTDPCDPPASFSKVAMENQSYTLTDTGKSYTHPDFSISPDYCPVDYSYEDTKFLDNSEMDATAIEQDGKTSKFFWDTD